ncbi:MAG: SDR family NAD(P)-dependent oxidoreductase [Thermaerobacter sp.]|nr:SDR family NAD(P)-dependent oxidoreductase [Thermaerobacter sp.]
MVTSVPASARLALVTGAARGIGRAIAVRLAADGHPLVIVDQDGSLAKIGADLEAGGARVLARQGDVSQAAFFDEVITEACARFGAIAILVNNAGITNNISKTERMPIDRWQRELDVNLSSVFYGARRTLPMMREAGWGRIINISSIAAVGGLECQPGYAASKAGILGLTQTIALEYAATGITCNAILPGMIATPAVRTMPRELRAQALRLIPAGNFGEPQEVAALASFLASEQARYITGAAIPVDGGAHLNLITLARIRP